MHPTLWIALCRRELIEITRGYAPLNGMMRVLLSVGVFLPWIAEWIPWPGAGLLSTTFPWLILGAGSAQLAVWVHEATERDTGNRETLAMAGVSPVRSLVARATVGVVVAILTGTAALGCLLLLAPAAHFSPGNALRGALSVVAGLVLSLICSLWVTSKTRPSSQSMPAIVFSLLVVWLGLPVAGELVREWTGYSLPAGVLDPVAMAASVATGSHPLTAGWTWLLVLCAGFLMTALLRVQRVPNPIRRRSRTSRLERLALGHLTNEPPEFERTYLRRLAPVLPDAIVYLKRAAWFFALATVCLVLQGSGHRWLWIALSTVVVGQMYYGAWIWHTCISLRAEDRRIGDAMISQGGFGSAGHAVSRWLNDASRWSRWTSVALYLVLSLVAWLGDTGFPWVLFLALSAVLPVMSSSLTEAARSLAERTSTGLQHFVGLAGLIVWPLLLGGMLGGAAGAKGFLTGTALGVLLVVIGLVTLGMAARSQRLSMTLRVILAWRDLVVWPWERRTTS